MPNPTALCSIADCHRPHKAHGLCQTHYRRQQRTGEVGLRSESHFFWKKVAVSGEGECWNWLGSRSSTGYGLFRGEKAHRYSARLAGMQIAELLVRHMCDNPLCVNPAHLIPGTNDDNMRDAVERSRFAVGSRQGSAKLTEADIEVILSMQVQGWSYTEIAPHFSVTSYTIYHVVNRKTWRHVEVPA